MRAARAARFFSSSGFIITLICGVDVDIAVVAFQIFEHLEEDQYWENRIKMQTFFSLTWPKLWHQQIPRTWKTLSRLQLNTMGTQVVFLAFIGKSFYFFSIREFLCLVLVELKAQCYRAYVCVRNTCCSCYMSWNVLPLTFPFWRRVICHEVSPTRRFGQQNPE